MKRMGQVRSLPSTFSLTQHTLSGANQSIALIFLRLEGQRSLQITPHFSQFPL
ncbi:hypothetical protein [Phormidesmis sp. 146-33]